MENTGEEILSRLEVDADPRFDEQYIVKYEFSNDEINTLREEGISSKELTNETLVNNLEQSGSFNFFSISGNQIEDRKTAQFEMKNGSGFLDNGHSALADSEYFKEKILLLMFISF